MDAGRATRGSARVPARVGVDTPDGPVEVATTASGDPGRAVAARNSIATALTSGAVDLRRRRRRGGTGWVALVGGGPGSDDLLTVRGHHLLAAADVVVVDRLAPRALLDRLPEGVEVIDVGKVPGRHQVSQDQINRILRDRALAGQGVVRLKGGDPYVLGRGAEERIVCEQAGIPVEVVSGVSSAIAAPAAAGIPVTHRGVARGFTVVTGHEQLGDLPIGSDHTLIVLMGIGGLAGTVRGLIAAGRDAHCPAAIIERAHLPGQRTTVAPLVDLAKRATAVGARSPAVIVIGDVVRVSPAWAVDDPAASVVAAGDPALSGHPAPSTQPTQPAQPTESAAPAAPAQPAQPARAEVAAGRTGLSS